MYNRWGLLVLQVSWWPSLSIWVGILGCVLLLLTATLHIHKKFCILKKEHQKLAGDNMVLTSEKAAWITDKEVLHECSDSMLDLPTCMLICLTNLALNGSFLRKHPAHMTAVLFYPL